MATTFDKLLMEPRRTDQITIKPTRTAENEAAQSPSLMLLVLLASAGVIVYAVFLLNPANRGDWLPYTLVMVAETVLVAHALLAMWTVLSSGHNPRGFAFHHAQDRLYDLGGDHPRRRRGRAAGAGGCTCEDRPVSVDVFITTYGEDLGTIRRTVTAAVAMQGEHDTWVLDDGRSDEVRDLAAELGRPLRPAAVEQRRQGRQHQPRAVASPRATSSSSSTPTSCPLPEFLHETVPFFATDDVAFVQTPQVYGNLDNLISRGAGYMQSVFYRFIQPGRNRFNAAFCVGTNVIFRRAAIDSIGGMYTDSKSEDVWTSLMLHEKRLADGLHPDRRSPSGTPRRPSRRTPSSSCAGRPAASRSCSRTTRCPGSARSRIDQRLQYLVTRRTT